MPIKLVAQAGGLGEDDYEPYGHYKCKVSEKITQKMAAQTAQGGGGAGYYVVVAGITPTPLGRVLLRTST